VALKVIRYKNYGCQMTSEDHKDKFYFSFYELSNGEIIELMLFQADNKGVILDQYEFSYTKMKLKSGEIRDYKFGNAKANDEEGMSEEFFKWFDSCPPAKDVISNTTPNKNEEKCINDFYLKYIETNKDIKTDTTAV
tara:strand:- start:268 stop:678 length:411 start_codon:yes stop_codon:yes gene_type:complete